MDLNTKHIQLQYQGFLNTPLLWKGASIFNLKQLALPKKNSSIFDGVIAKNLRLGKRVERFVNNEVKQYSNISIVAENIQIQNKKTTVGEIDFIIQQNEIPIHLEVVYKFYLYDKRVGDTELEHWIGPNRNDNLVNKLKKLKEKQLPLLYRSETGPLLKKLNLNPETIQQRVYFKAQLFIPYKTEKTSSKLIDTNCIIGFYIHFKELSQFSNCKFHIPTRVNWLQNIQKQIDWKTYSQISPEIEDIINKKVALLCWVKYDNGELSKIFIVWWE